MPRVALEGELTVQIIASPELSHTDATTLRQLESTDQVAQFRAVIVDRVLEEIVALLDNPTDQALRARVFAWLVANDRLQIKFAFPDHVEQAGIFHEKIGVFDFPGGERAAFTGSANESMGGHRRNYESIDVYRSWMAGDEERVRIKCEQFDEAWENTAEGLSVLAPSSSVLQRLRAKAPSKPAKSETIGPEVQEPDRRWRHQKEARERFFEVGHGVLEMATGTGKTRTSLSIESELFDRGEIETVVITANGTDLLEQWYVELAKRPRRVYRAYERYHEAQEYLNDPEDAVMLTSRLNLKDILPRLPTKSKSRALIICDEVHGMGSPAMIRDLPGMINPFKWRLGLSATPEREYDEDGNSFIESEIGEVIYRFPIEEAIRRGILCEFDYHDLEYEFSEEDRAAVSQVIQRYHARAQGPDPQPIEFLYQDIARIRKLSREKLAPFRKLVESQPHLLDRCLIFVATTEYGLEVQDILMHVDIRYHTYYGGDDRANLQRFARGRLNCLLTCRRISEGIDIRSVSSIVLFSSERAMLETVQRLGRCLRTDPTDPDKRASVIDFIRIDGVEDQETEDEKTADMARRDKMRAWSAVQREE